MPRPRKFKVEDVLAKAVSCFSTHGYHATSVGVLTQRLGIGHASIYGTFGSKRGLFVSALRFDIERCEATWREIVDQSPAPAATLRGVLTSVACSGGFIVRTAIELVAQDEETERILAETYSTTEHLFSTLIEQGQRAGEIAPDVDPGPVARSLLVLCFGAVMVGEPALMQQAVQALLPAPSAQDAGA